MATLVLSPIGTGVTFFGGNTSASNPNIPLAGGLLWVYAAGTTTPVTTYTSATGLSNNTNPIVLQPDGRIPFEIWWAIGASYKFVLQDSLGNNIPNATWDNIPGINDPTAIGPIPATLITYTPPGSGAVATTVSEYLARGVYWLSNTLPVGYVTNGSVDYTAQFTQACLNAAAAGKLLGIDSGIFQTAAQTFPANFLGIIGQGEQVSQIYIKRTTYTSGQVMLYANSTGLPLVFQGFSINTDDPVFTTWLTYGLACQSVNDVLIRDVKNTGRGQTGIYLSGVTKGLVDNCEIVGTGSGYQAGIYGINCTDVDFNKPRVTGITSYGALFGATSNFCKILNGHCESSTSFGFSLGGCNYSHIIGCTTKDTGHEGVQITDSLFCSMELNTCEWTSLGTDTGMSINGNTLSANYNKMIGNTIVNAYTSGFLVANQAKYNVVSNNTFRDCGVRGTANAVANCTALGSCYVDGSHNAALNFGNAVKFNKSVAETGAVSNGYFEAVGSGGGATVAGSVIQDNEFAGTITTLYTLFDYTTSRISDLLWRNYTPVPTATGGNPTVTINSAAYRLQGNTAFVRWDITFTALNGATSNLTIPLPTNFGSQLTNAGYIGGREIVNTGSSVAAIPSGTGAIVVTYNNAFPIAANSRIIAEGSYALS